MPDTPGSPTPEEVMAEKMAEMDKMKADLAAERQQLAADRQNNDELNRTMAGLTDAMNNANRPAPPPEPELEGEYDETTLRAAAQLTKRSLEAYHNEMAPRHAALEAGQFESEWRAAKTADPKNFGRMEQTMRKHFDSNPALKQPGAVDTLFVQMKGQHYDKLQEMDRADRQKEIENPEPNPTNYIDKSNKSDSIDTLTDDEGGMIRGVNRGVEDEDSRTQPEHYYLAKHGHYPNFEEGYLEKRGYKPVERGAK